METTEVTIGDKYYNISVNPEQKEREVGYVNVPPVTHALLLETDIKEEDEEEFIWVLSDDHLGDSKKIPVVWNRWGNYYDIVDRSMRLLVDKPVVKLVNEDGNVFSIMGRCRRAARKAGWNEKQWSALYKEMTSGNYDHALWTVMEYFEEPKEEGEY